MKIFVKVIGDAYIDCPLRSDLNSCQATNSKINSCPESVETENGRYYVRVPKICPLRKEQITIYLEEVDYGI